MRGSRAIPVRSMSGRERAHWGGRLASTRRTGFRLGGVLVSNGNYLVSGGNNPGRASFNNLLVIDLGVDLDKAAGIPGAKVGAALLRFDGQPTNQQAGVATGYNGLPGAPPLHRTELYELWWRQSFLDDKLVVRFGKTVPTNDFGNVVRPVPVQDVSLQIPAVSSLIYTPIFVNPTILGALPGYYNSAYGITATITPSKRFYVSLGPYDGNGARGEQTGLREAPTFNSYRFNIGEIGTAWPAGSIRRRSLEPDRAAHPGNVATNDHAGRNLRRLLVRLAAVVEQHARRQCARRVGVRAIRR